MLVFGVIFVHFVLFVKHGGKKLKVNKTKFFNDYGFFCGD
jgi:hypothetical protein